MLKSIHLLIITVLLTLSAQAEIKTSIPDFSKCISTSLSAIEVELSWTNSLPCKNKVVEEHVRQYFHQISWAAAAQPLVSPFEKKIFISQTLQYRSLSTPSFHLLI